jgi:hypothetical protein
MSATQILDSLLNKLGIILGDQREPQFGENVIAKIIPSLSGESVSDIIEADFDWTLVAKGVLFNTDDPTREDPIAPLKAYDFTRVPSTLLEGVPGFLAKIKGKFPVVAQVPVQLEIRWSVHAEDGRELTEGVHYIAPNGVSSLEATFVFIPEVHEVVELTEPPKPPLVNRKIRARVRLKAGKTQTNWKDLPELSLTLRGLSIPTVLAFFMHANFAGPILLVVPSSSPIRGINQLRLILGPLQSAVSLLSKINRFASLLLNLQQLGNILNSDQFNIVFQRTDQIRDLNEIVLVQGSWYENDIEADDELSSVIFIGPTDRRVECFNWYHWISEWISEEGKFTLTIGSHHFAVIKNLHSGNPASEPKGDEIMIDVQSDERGNYDPTGPKVFGDTISSLRFH